MSGYIGYSNFPTLDQVLNPAKPVEDIGWIAQRLTRTGTSWSSTLGQGVTVTWSASATDAGQSAFPGNTFAQLNADQIHAAEMATRAWSDVANINFVRVGSGYTGAGAYSDAGQVRMQGYSYSPTGAQGMSEMPGHGTAVTEVLTGGDYQGSYNWVPDGFNASGGYANMLHELGHVMGLSHPDDYQTPFPQYDTASSYYQASKLFSIMAYPDGRVGVLTPWQVPMTPGIDDIAAAQRLYGANMTTRTGDTVYGFHSNADEPYFRIDGDPNQSFVRFTVWDAGGNDTFDFSGYDYNHVIDLREGHLSSVSHLAPGNSPEGYNVGIAYGTVIENAIGGSGGEMMYGNDANNHIVGNGGADFINGRRRGTGHARWRRRQRPYLRQWVGRRGLGRRRGQHPWRCRARLHKRQRRQRHDQRRRRKRSHPGRPGRRPDQRRCRAGPDQRQPRQRHRARW